MHRNEPLLSPDLLGDERFPGLKGYSTRVRSVLARCARKVLATAFAIAAAAYLVLARSQRVPVPATVDNAARVRRPT